jgi:hypothetical protein
MDRFTGLVIFLASASAAFSQGHAPAKDPGADYTPPTAADRARWVIRGTIGPPNIAASLFTSAWGTLQDSPKEYGTHWDGFGGRIALRTVGVTSGRTIEGTLGSFWGEDPRYIRTSGRPAINRIGHVFKMTFMSTNRDGEAMPAYARFIAVPSNSFLSNTWRPNSEATTRDAVGRIPTAFIDRLIGNAFAEFFPDLRQHIFRSKAPQHDSVERAARQ